MGRRTCLADAPVLPGGGPRGVIKRQEAPPVARRASARRAWGAGFISPRPAEASAFQLGRNRGDALAVQDGGVEIAFVDF
jgi:hypothetical protein